MLGQKITEFFRNLPRKNVLNAEKKSKNSTNATGTNAIIAYM